MAVAAAEQRDGGVGRHLVVRVDVGLHRLRVAREVRELRREDGAVRVVVGLVERLEDRVTTRGARDVRERLGDAREPRLLRILLGEGREVRVGALERADEDRLGLLRHAREREAHREDEVALGRRHQHLHERLHAGRELQLADEARCRELPELDLVHALDGILRIADRRGELLDRLRPVGRRLDDHHRVLEILHEVDRLGLRRLELGEAVPERVDEALIGDRARLREARRALRGVLHVLVVLARLVVLEGLGVRRRGAHVAHVAEELHEILARLLVETAGDVRLGQGLDGVVEDPLHLRIVVLVRRRRRAHRVVEERVEALDRGHALRGIVEPLGPRLRIVLVGAADDGRGGERCNPDGREERHPRERTKCQGGHGGRDLLHASFLQIAKRDAKSRENPPISEAGQ